MKVTPFIGSPVFVLAIGISACLACSSETDGDGGSGDAGGSIGWGGQSGSGTSGDSGSGGQSGSGTSGGGSSGIIGGDSDTGSMAGSAAADAGADAGGGASSGIIDGSLDPTFGVDGIALLDLEGQEQFTGVAIQPSGKIVVVGMIDKQACIARFTREGALDSSFGNMGLTLAEVSDTVSAFNDVDQQSDGSLIAVGLSRNATQDMVVARFGAEGQLDNAFGTDGFIMIDTGGEDTAAELIVLPDDTILIGGSATPAATGRDFAVAHLDADGILNPNFGSAGLAFAHYGQRDTVSG